MNHVAVHMQKLKSNGAIRGHAKHNVREYSPENVISENTPDNYQLLGDVSTSDQLMGKVRQRLEKVDRKIRKDAVRAVEIYVTGTSQKMHSLTRKERDGYFKDSLKYIQSIFGKENVLSAHVHMDEKSPHLHILATPVTKDGRLHLRSFIDGRKDLVHFQDKFGKIGEKYGLERGVRGSKEKHKTQKAHVAEMKKELKKLEPVREKFESKKKFMERWYEHVRTVVKVKLDALLAENKKLTKYSDLTKNLKIHKLNIDDREKLWEYSHKLAKERKIQIQKEAQERKQERDKAIEQKRQEKSYERIQKAMKPSQEQNKSKKPRSRGGMEW